MGTSKYERVRIHKTIPMQYNNYNIIVRGPTIIANAFLSYNEYPPTKYLIIIINIYFSLIISTI